MTETIFTNAQVVTRDEIFTGTVVFNGDGTIKAADPGLTNAPGAEDLGGDYIMPGLIEMHTDNMEKHFEPRPGVLWPSPMAAVMAHDAQIATSGITTVFDAIAVGEYGEDSHRHQILNDSIAAVKHGQREGVFRADHLLHLRCEVSDPCVVEMFEPFIGDPIVQLVSIMDHTPGQRQWSDVAKFVQYNKGEKWSEEELASILRKKNEQQEKYSHKHRREIVKICQERNVPLASHDDATEDHVRESIEDGMRIAEFPITFEAAKLARENGMGTIMGAPNVVRGGSHSGNISAADLAAKGDLDGLSSDYVPHSLLHAPFILHDKLGIELHDAIAKVSANIADMVGLEDRGEIKVGKRADLIHVTRTDHAPVVRAAWRTGERVG